MTGLDVQRHRVIEICVERVVGARTVERLESFVRPEPLGDTVGNHHVHGIDAHALREAPTFAALVPQIRALLDDAVMVAHGARWDAAFLRAEMARAGHAPWAPSHHIDTLALSRRLLTVDSHRLDFLAESLNIPSPRHHRAANDVAVTRALFEALLQAAGRQGMAATTPRAVWDWCVGKGAVQPAVLEAADRAAERGMPVSVRYRAARRGVQELEFVVTEVRRDLDPPVVLGYLHHTRGRRELRADRILSLELLAP